MKRLSITLPEELVARIEPFKDRINVSQVCREALERRVTASEEARGLNGSGIDMDGVVTRLREERSAVEGKWEALGAINASTWVSAASYLELKSVLECQGTGDLAGYRLPSGAYKIMKRDMGQVGSGWERLIAAAYKTAWLDALKEVWARIKPIEDTPEAPAQQAAE
jgi:hypothetical protein